MFYKSLPFEVKANETNRTFEGYASKFGNVDLHNDIIERGAFSKTIKERLPKNAIKVFWQHMEPIGFPLKLEETEEGLYVQGKISKTRLGDEAIELMKDKVVDGMSIGYDVIKDEEDEKGVRRLKELKLYEVSVVTWGANPEAMITNVKHLNALQTILQNDSMKSFTDMQKALERLNDTLNGGVFGTKDGNIILNIDELKAGRVLSTKNRNRLEEAMGLIQVVLDTADESANKSWKQVEPEDNETEEDFMDRCMIAEQDAIPDEDERRTFCQLQWEANLDDDNDDDDNADDDANNQNNFDSEEFKALLNEIRAYAKSK